jgi:hypothetical protein
MYDASPFWTEIDFYEIVQLCLIGWSRVKRVKWIEAHPAARRPPNPPIVLGMSEPPKERRMRHCSRQLATGLHPQIQPRAALGEQPVLGMIRLQKPVAWVLEHLHRSYKGPGNTSPPSDPQIQLHR